jgi:hypothetical protein
MPMLHGCSFPGCDTRTLSAYCWEHERLLRCEIDDEREQAAMRDHPLARELAALYAARETAPVGAASSALKGAVSVPRVAS